MSNWEETLTHFRVLGGVADNVDLREGINGRGLFPRDQSQPAKLFIPNNLLVPTEWLQLDTQGNVILSDACDWHDEVRSFYLTYLNDYGFNEVLIQEMLDQQSQLFKLPDSLKAMMKGFGFASEFFQAPTRQVCLEKFKKSRRIIVNQKLVLIPLVELINHDEQSKKLFHINNEGVGVSGKFEDEVLVHYGMAGDAVSMYQAYDFSTLKPYAFSGSLSINLGSKIIKIARYINLYNKIDKTNVPKLSVKGNEINLSFLVLGSMYDRTSPKKIFLKLMANIGMPVRMAEDVFNGIVNMNRQFFNNLLKELEPLSGSVVDGLRIMAENQLMAIGDK